MRSSSEIYDWCYARRRNRVFWDQRLNVWRILREVAEPVGRAETIGRPWLWRLKREV